MAVVLIGLGTMRSFAVSAAQELPAGRIIDTVTSSADATQSYALYLPSNYTPTRVWPLLIGFHPVARGRAMVETYQAAAEQYGYIVIGSNNSRNGSWESSRKSIAAMTSDVFRRFPIAEGRFYLTGMSGGSRVALQVALSSGKIDGVIASSAGYPDSQTRSSVSFPIFGTAGTEDFNYVEMKLLGRELKTPHRIVIFEGGHQLPPAAVALQGVEWLEVQAMVKGARARDTALIDRLYAKGLDAAEHASTPAEQAQSLEALATDFKGLRDLTELNQRVTSMLKDKDIKKALSQEKSNDYAEARLMNDLIELEAGLANQDTYAQSLLRLRDTLSQTFKKATATSDSPERQQSRRVLRAITAGGAERVQDPAYRQILQGFRLPGSGRGGGPATSHF